MDNEKIIDMSENTTEIETSENNKKSKNNRISINAFEKAMNKTYAPLDTVVWNDLELKIKRTISLKDVMDIVNNVTGLCFADDGTFIPEVKDIALKAGIIEKYTNLALPRNIEFKYKLIYCTDVFNVVTTHINPQQFKELLYAVERKLDYEAKTNIAKFNKQMEKLLDAFESVEHQLASVFKGVDDKSMVELIDAIKDGKIDEQKLVQSYFDVKDNREQVSDAVDSNNKEIVVGGKIEEND